jgi:hypothetical protein
MRARDLIARAMRAASSVLLLQTLAEFSNRENVYFDDGLSVDCNGRCAGEVGFYRVIALCRTEF